MVRQRASAAVCEPEAEIVSSFPWLLGLQPSHLHRVSPLLPDLKVHQPSAAAVARSYCADYLQRRFGWLARYYQGPLCFNASG